MAEATKKINENDAGHGVFLRAARRPRERNVDPGQGSHDAAGHAVIRDAHGVVRWTSNPADAPGAERRGFDINQTRLSAVERLIVARHGGPVDTDDWPAYASVALNALALRDLTRGWRPTAARLLAWACSWFPTAPADEIHNLAAKVIARPRRFKAATAGRLLALRAIEWQALGLQTLHPIDVPAEQIEAVRKNRKADADRQRRARERDAKGGRSRADYVAESVAEQARREGVSRKTVYARRKRQAEQTAKGNTSRASISVDHKSYSGAQPVTPRNSNLAFSRRPRAEALARLWDIAATVFAPHFPIQKSDHNGGCRHAS